MKGQKENTMAHKNASITGRDSYITTQAMLYALGYIQSLPDERQEWSNMLDMCMIVRAQRSPLTIMHILNLERFHGFKINLWPEEDEDLSEAEKLKRDEFRKAYERCRAQASEPFSFMPTPTFAGYDPIHMAKFDQMEDA